MLTECRVFRGVIDPDRSNPFKPADFCLMRTVVLL
jgi:hypothetical protein